MRTAKVLSLAAGVIALLALLVGTALYGYGRGWHLARRSSAELSALLRPHDEVFVPEGAGPFPTVIQFHGCGGKHENQRDWALRLRDAGFAAVVVDSFAGRGATGDAVCTGRALLPAERAGDVLVTLDHVRELPFVDRERVVLAGWSHGGVTLLQLLAMNPPDELPPNLAPQSAGHIGLDGVAGVVLVYPYCGIGSRAGVWLSQAPTLFLVAGDDQTAAPGPCIELADALRDAGRPVELRVYPGVDHAFDHRAWPGGPNPAYDPEAVEAAARDLQAFLSRVAARRKGA